MFKYTIILLLFAVIVFGKDTNVSVTAASKETTLADHVTDVAKHAAEDATQTTTSRFTVAPFTNATTIGPKTTTTSIPPPTSTPHSTTTPVPVTTTTTVPPTTPAPTTPTTAIPTIAPTTPAPTAPTTIIPITTSAPPKQDAWVVNNNGTICILAKMDISLDLKVKGLPKDITMKVPTKTVNVSGICGKNEQTLDLYWDANGIAFNFKSNETLKKYYLHSVAVNITAGNVTVKLSEGNITMFETSLKNSYKCSYSDPLKLSDNDTSVVFTLSNIKVDAFKTDNTTVFANEFSCPPDVPDIVPIVVGCALTVLVVVVLIAYLVGRRRTQARGYLSM